MSGTIVRGSCTVCFAPVYRREVTLQVNKPTAELTQSDLVASDTPTVPQLFYVFSMEPFGSSIEYCPFCGSRYM